MKCRFWVAGFQNPAELCFPTGSSDAVVSFNTVIIMCEMVFHLLCCTSWELCNCDHVNHVEQTYSILDATECRETYTVYWFVFFYTQPNIQAHKTCLTISISVYQWVCSQSLWCREGSRTLLWVTPADEWHVSGQAYHSLRETNRGWKRPTQTIAERIQPSLFSQSVCQNDDSLERLSL